MTFNIIRLNPSQELKLVQKERDASAEIPDSFIRLQPLACILPESFTREDFLSVKRLGIYRHCISEENFLILPCRIEYDKGVAGAVLPFAIKTQDNVFSLQEVFLKAKGLPDTFSEALFSQENILFTPTSFKMCRARVEENSWALYDEVWKKIK